MNNYQNFDNFGRALKQEKDSYIQKFQDKQDAENESNALLYEGLTGPFIEQSGMNILKAGIKSGARKAGIDDETINNISDIGDDLTKGNWSSAGSKIQQAGKKVLYNKVNENFINDKSKVLDTLQGKVQSTTYTAKGKVQSGNTTAEDINKRFAELSSDNKEIALGRTRNLDIDDYDGQSKILDDLEKITPEKTPIPSIPSQPIIKPNTDPLAPIQYENLDASTGIKFNPLTKIVKPTTESNLVFDENGKPLIDENEVQRQNLEDRLARNEDSPAETRQLQSRLKNMINETQTSEDLSPRLTMKQSLDNFLQKYKKQSIKPEEVSISGDNTPTAKPLINPRDVADDSSVTKSGAYSRGINGYKVDARNIPGEGDITLQDTSVGIDRTINNPVFDTDSIPDSKPVSKLQADALKRASEGDFSVKNPNRSSELKDAYNKLSDNGKQLYENKVNSAGLDRYDYGSRQKLIQQSDIEDKASIQQQQQQQQKPLDKEKPKPLDEDKPPPVLEDKPPPDGPSLGSDIDKAVGEGAEVDAEAGGPEDIVGDVIGLGVGIGTLLFGLHKSHESSQPPPLLQLNPTIQLGEGQE